MYLHLRWLLHRAYLWYVYHLPTSVKQVLYPEGSMYYDLVEEAEALYGKKK